MSFSKRTLLADQRSQDLVVAQGARAVAGGRGQGDEGYLDTATRLPAGEVGATEVLGYLGFASGAVVVGTVAFDDCTGIHRVEQNGIATGEGDVQAVETRQHDLTRQRNPCQRDAGGGKGRVALGPQVVAQVSAGLGHAGCGHRARGSRRTGRAGFDAGGSIQRAVTLAGDPADVASTQSRCAGGRTDVGPVALLRPVLDAVATDRRGDAGGRVERAVCLAGQTTRIADAEDGRAGCASDIGSIALLATVLHTVAAGRRGFAAAGVEGAVCLAGQTASPARAFDAGAGRAAEVAALTLFAAVLEAIPADRGRLAGAGVEGAGSSASQVASVTRTKDGGTGFTTEVAALTLLIPVKSAVATGCRGGAGGGVERAVRQALEVTAVGGPNEALAGLTIKVRPIAGLGLLLLVVAAGAGGRHTTFPATTVVAAAAIATVWISTSASSIEEPVGIDAAARDSDESADANGQAKPKGKAEGGTVGFHC